MYGFPTSCLRDNSEEKNWKFPKIKLNKIDKVFMCKIFTKMLRRYWGNDKFLKILLRVYLEKFTDAL